MVCVVLDHDSDHPSAQPAAKKHPRHSSGRPRLASAAASELFAILLGDNQPRLLGPGPGVDPLVDETSRLLCLECGVQCGFIIATSLSPVCLPCVGMAVLSSCQALRGDSACNRPCSFACSSHVGPVPYGSLCVLNLVESQPEVETQPPASLGALLHQTPPDEGGSPPPCTLPKNCALHPPQPKWGGG